MLNLARLAETFLHLIDKDQKIAIKKIEHILNKNEKKYKNLWLSMMKNKIDINQNHEKDAELIKELLDLMHVFKLDYTNTFINIENNNIEKYDFMKGWYIKYKDRKKLNEKKEYIKNQNPKLIPRNHNIENILNEAENGNLENLKNIIMHLKNPYSENVPENIEKNQKKKKDFIKLFAELKFYLYQFFCKYIYYR